MWWLPMVAAQPWRDLPQIYTGTCSITFFGDHSRRVLADRGNSGRLATVENNIKFLIFMMLYCRQNYIHAKSVIGIPVLVRSDPDPWNSSIRLWFVAKSVNPDFTVHLWMRYSMDSRFKTVDIYMKKGVMNLSLGLNYCSIGPSRPPSRDTVP
jgi:hypothetical protein